MIFKIFLTAFLAAMLLFIILGSRGGFSNKVRLLIRLGIVALLAFIIIIYFGRKVL